MSKVSVIIPSRNDEYLPNTTTDLLLKAEGDVEIIVVYDGYKPTRRLGKDPRIIRIEREEWVGMRTSINQGMAMATGDYVMKIDEHCMVSQGWDEHLKRHCEEGWVVIPRRRRLLPDSWELQEDGRPPVDYMKIDYPYQRPGDKTCGLHGSEDRKRYEERKDHKIDDVMTMQGSCYFMLRSTWERYFPNGLDVEHYGEFTQEAQEISNTAWLSGGRVIVNKQVWYAHYHKGKRGKGYGFTTEQYKKHCEWNERGRLYCIKYWLETKDFKYDFDWLLRKFEPEGWNIETWKEDVVRDSARDYSTLGYKDDFWLSNLAKI